MLPMIFVLPLMQLLVLVNAATFEMKSIKMVVVDSDLSSTSRELVAKFSGSPFFKVEKMTMSMAEAEKEIELGRADCVLKIPVNFEKQLIRENHNKIQLLVNAINGTVAGLTNAYTGNVLADYNREVTAEWINYLPNQVQPKMIKTTFTHWYNPELNYRNFMVPGIIVILVTIIGMFLSSMNLVKEKEVGTIEQLNVTPIRKFHFITGKLLPFWIIALFELGLGLTIGKLVFNIPIVGSIVLIYFVAGTYLLVILGIGLFVSTVTNTQQQAMFISWFILLVCIMMSGLFTSVDNLPEWAMWINKLNPIMYFIKMMRMVIMKGSTFADIRQPYFITLAYGIAMLTLAAWQFKKTS
jgi:ABC-2 type transport system permease protein